MAVRRPKRSRLIKQVEVEVRVGELTPITKEQIVRLRAFVECQVLTWARADLNDRTPINVVCNEDMTPRRARE